MVNSLQDRTCLHDRHRLSHQQIDKWLGENSRTEFLPEKLKQLESVKTFLWVTDLIRKEGISFISLKGPLLSYRIYKDPTVRISHDIDLLVDIKFIGPVVKILTDNGYTPFEGVVWPTKKIQQELLLDICHHVSFVNKKRNSCVEVHWALMQEVPVSYKKQMEIIEQNTTEIEFSGRKFTVLNKEFELLFLLIHGARHGWSRLKWLVDIKDYPVNDLDGGKFEALVSQLNAGRVIGQSNLMLNEFFGIQLPYRGDDRLPGYFIRFAIQSIRSNIKVEAELSNRELLNNFRYLLVVFPGGRYKFQIIRRAFFNPVDISKVDLSSKIMYLLFRHIVLLKEGFCMYNNWFIVKSFGLFYRYKPIRLIILFSITLFLGLTQGVTIVLLIPLLSLLEPVQSLVSSNKWIVFVHSMFSKLGIEVNLTLTLAVFAISLIMVAILNYFQTTIQAAYQQEFSYEIRKRLFKKLITSRWSFLNGKSKYNHIQVLTTEIPKMTTYYYFYLGLTAKLIFILTHIVLALILSVKFTLFVIGVGLLVLVFLRKYIKRAAVLGSGNIQSFRKMLKQIDDFWLTVKMAKVHNSEEFYFRKFDDSSNQILGYQFKQIKNRAVPQFFFSLAGIVAMIAIVFLAYHVAKLPMTALFVLILLFARIFPQFMGLNSDLDMLISNVESVRMVLKMDQEMEEREFDKKENRGEIEFNHQLEIINLSFGYQPDINLFTNFCESIPAKQMTGIVGKSGCGKTTLIDIIAGLQKSEDGVVVVDGVVLSDDKLPAWRSELGYLPQDSFFIDGTIRENLIWDSGSDLTDSQIIEVLKLVNADQLVFNQKQELDTAVVNYQYHFSGGERQRLALARVLIRNPRVLLLDEATSALDPGNEAQIMDCLVRLKKDITIVFVTHRESLRPYFDKIIDLNEKE